MKLRCPCRDTRKDYKEMKGYKWYGGLRLFEALAVREEVKKELKSHEAWIKSKGVVGKYEREKLENLRERLGELESLVMDLTR